MYDVALTFAGEDRRYVETVATKLKEAEVRVFYDRLEEATLWGKDLYTHLDEVYRKLARYCVMFISKHYRDKLWTNHERESAQARAFEENQEYILPARFDDTEIPGVRPTTGYLDLRRHSPESVAELILQKLGRSPVAESVPSGGKFRLPRIAQRAFNPYDEAQNLIKYLADGLQDRAGALADRGGSFSRFEREGRTCLRFLLHGKTRYALDVWMGGFTGDASLAFAFQRGEPRFTPGSMNAWGTVRWSQTRDEPVLPFSGFMGQAEKEYTYPELLDAFWDQVCTALESER